MSTFSEEFIKTALKDVTCKESAQLDKDRTWFMSDPGGEWNWPSGQKKALQKFMNNRFSALAGRSEGGSDV